MPRPSSLAQVEIETGEQSERLEQPEPDAPFHIAILGDFSGRESRSALDSTLQGRKPFLIDRDNFDDVVAGLAPELRLPLGSPDGPQVALRFRELEDFHPDHIVNQVKIFRALCETREDLHNPARYESAAAHVRSWSGEIAPTPPTTAADLSRLSASELFEQALSATEARSSASPARAMDDFQALLRDIVAPYAAPKPDPQLPALIAQVDATVSGGMRALLHHPRFQALEAAWRAVFFMVRRLPTDANLKVFVIDIAKPELAADMVATFQCLIERTPRGQPWSVLVGNYTFDHTDDDVQLLGRMAAVARHAGAPFLAAASPCLLGCESLGDMPEPRSWRPVRAGPWNALRRLPQASWLGLVLPRFLLRLPYGKHTSATETFTFEEFGDAPAHEDYLWGNAALACAGLLGEAFSESGWDLRPGDVNEITGLPLYVSGAGGESSLKPCAEVHLSASAVETILDHGLMPFLSDVDSIRMVRFQSIAEPLAALSGRWG
jgi:type VI secretion system protein ImpC